MGGVDHSLRDHLCQLTGCSIENWLRPLFTRVGMVIAPTVA